MNAQEFFEHCQAIIDADETIQYECESQLVEYMSMRDPAAWAMAKEVLIAEDPTLDEFEGFTPSVGEAIDHGFEAIDQSQFLTDLDEGIGGLLDGRFIANEDFVD